ncbi:MAG: FKBP-type peptidyl-prolyl cis-trans isomerase [Bacteroidota bacterium]
MKLIQVYFVVLTMSLLISCQNSSQGGFGDASADLTTQLDSVSYVLGNNIGNNLKSEPSLGKADLNLAAMMRGLQDGLAGNESLIDEQAINQLMTSFQNQLLEEKKEQNDAFFEENKNKEGVVVLPSGLQYKILEEGDGPIPTEEDEVRVHYRGTLLNGEQFDSSYDGGEPVEFPVTRVIGGWIEALQLMKVGAKWELYIPPSLAYGPQGQRGSIIGPEEALIFQVELLGIVAPEE